MTVITDEERRAGYVGAMGQPLGDLHHDIENEVALLLRKWNDFDELFNDFADMFVHEGNHIEMVNVAGEGP